MITSVWCIGAQCVSIDIEKSKNLHEKSGEHKSSLPFFLLIVIDLLSEQELLILDLQVLLQIPELEGISESFQHDFWWITAEQELIIVGEC